MKIDLSQIPAAEGVYKVAKGQGERIDFAGVRFTWKVKGDETACAFSIYEQMLNPREGVPPHTHPYAEVFYILDGAVDFLRVIDGQENWVCCENEETIKRSSTSSPDLTEPNLFPKFQLKR
jgi:hypothetical protein